MTRAHKVNRAHSLREGRSGERQVRRAVARAGWRPFEQAGSGAVGARAGNRASSCDIVAICGDHRLRIEVKKRRREPKTMMVLSGGCEILAYICSDTGRMMAFIDEQMFVDLLSWAADGIAAADIRQR